MEERLAALITEAREYDLIGLDDKLNCYLYVKIGEKESL